MVLIQPCVLKHRLEATKSILILAETQVAFGSLETNFSECCEVIRVKSDILELVESLDCVLELSELTVNTEKQLVYDPDDAQIV